MSLRPSLLWDKAPFSCTSMAEPSLLWDIILRRSVAGCRRFETAVRPMFNGQGLGW